MDIDISKNKTDSITISPNGDSLSITILLDGNNGKRMYYYEGKFAEKKKILQTSFDSTGLNTCAMNHSFDSSLFIIKWGGNAKYSSVIDAIDLLKKCSVHNYALIPISQEELMALSNTEIH